MSDGRLVFCIGRDPICGKREKPVRRAILQRCRVVEVSVLNAHLNATPIS